MTDGVFISVHDRQFIRSRRNYVKDKIAEEVISLNTASDSRIDQLQTRAPQIVDGVVDYPKYTHVDFYANMTSDDVIGKFNRIRTSIATGYIAFRNPEIHNHLELLCNSSSYVPDYVIYCVLFQYLETLSSIERKLFYEEHMIQSTTDAGTWYPRHASYYAQLATTFLSRFHCSALAEIQKNAYGCLASGHYEPIGLSTIPPHV